MSKTKKGMAETELAAFVVRHFLDIGAEVHQEVAPWGSAGARADIVAVLGSVIHVVEVKASFTLDVIEQAWHWRIKNMAHRVSVAVPRSKKNEFRRRVCREFGIGVYLVKASPEEWHQDRVEEIEPSPLIRRADTAPIRKVLNERTQSYAAAGNNKARFWSPFKETCEALRSVVEAQPGLTWREAMKRVKHHYASDSSAASTLYRLAQDGKVESLAWLACTNDRPARLYLAGTARPAVQTTSATLFAKDRA